MSSKEKYHHFCKAENTLPIFFQDWYLDAIYGKAGWDILLYEQNKDILAAFPFCKKRKLFFDYIRTQPFGRTMGIFTIPKIKGTKQEKKAVKTLLQQLPIVHYFEQNFDASFSNWLPLYWNGFQQTTRYTYVLDNIQNMDLVWGNLIPDYKNNKIKYATDTLTVQSNLSLKEFYIVNKKTFDRQHIKIPYTFEQLKNMDDILKEKNARKLFFATDNQSKIHAVLYLIWDKETAYYHIAGDDPSLRKSGASIFLIYHAIKYSSEILKLNRFDFEGSMLSGIEPVRRNFGAKQIPYFTIRKFNPSFLSLFYDLNNIFSK